MTAPRPCTNCHEPRKIEARGLCRRCYLNALQSRTLEQFPVSETRARARAQADMIVALLTSGMTRHEVAAELGVTYDVVNGIARRRGVTQTRDDVGRAPGEPACAGSNHPGFIVDMGSHTRLTADQRELVGEALTFCDRCPAAVKDWCVDLISPGQSRWTGVAGGSFYVDGQQRPNPAVSLVGAS